MFVVTGVQVIAVNIGNGGLFVVFITTIPALQICFTGNVVQATAVAKTQVHYISSDRSCAITQHKWISALLLVQSTTEAWEPR